MSVSLKRLAASIGAFLLLLAVTLPMAALLLRDPLVNSDPVREEITALLFELTGRRVEISGEIDIDEFPWITVIIGPGKLDNPDGFTGPPLLEWNEVRLRIHYSSVYADSPLLEPVIVSGLRINLQRDAQGRDNWSDLGPLVDTGPPTAPLALPGIELRGLELAYLDSSSSAQSRADLTNANLLIKDIQRGAGAIEGTRWRIGSIELQGQGTARIADSALSGELRARLGDIDARLPEDTVQQVTIDAMDFEFGVLRAIFGEMRWAPPMLTAGLELRPAALDALLRTVGIEPPFASAPRRLQLKTLRTRLQLEDGTLHLRGLDAQIDDTRIRGDLSLGEPIDLALEVDSLDLERYAAALAADPAQSPAGTTVFPGRLLQGLPLSGSLRIGELRSSGAVLAGVTLRLESAARTTARPADNRPATPTDGRPPR